MDRRVENYDEIRDLLKPVKQFKRKSSKHSGGKRSVVEKFFQQNPNLTMPNNFSEIAKLVGCSNETARSYYRRKVKRVNDKIFDTLDEFFKKNQTFRTTKNQIFPTTAVYEWFFVPKNRLTRRILVLITLKNQSRHAIVFDISKTKVAQAERLQFVSAQDQSEQNAPDEETSSLAGVEDR